MNQRLIYLVGPSGAGKDSLLDWLRQHLAPDLPLHWARRTVTRAPQAQEQAHEFLDETDFAAQRQQGAFALHWQANGLHYGIRNEQISPLDSGHWVFVNGSRAHLNAAQTQYPGLTVVCISASPHILRQRLCARGRETACAIEARIARTQEFDLSQALQVQNDGTLEQAGQALLRRLQTLPGWPT